MTGRSGVASRRGSPNQPFVTNRTASPSSSAAAVEWRRCWSRYRSCASADRAILRPHPPPYRAHAPSRCHRQRASSLCSSRLSRCPASSCRFSRFKCRSGHNARQPVSRPLGQLLIARTRWADHAGTCSTPARYSSRWSEHIQMVVFLSLDAIQFGLWSDRFQARSTPGARCPCVPQGHIKSAYKGQEPAGQPAARAAPSIEGRPGCTPGRALRTRQGVEDGRVGAVRTVFGFSATGSRSRRTRHEGRLRRRC